MIPAHRVTAWVILRAVVNTRLTNRCRVAALATIAVALAACGSDAGSTTRDSAGATPSKTATTQRARPTKLTPLDANSAAADRIVGEGEDALKQRLATLKGVPVVVNQWASWCPPCIAEIPFFDTAADKYRDAVAFVGIDFLDKRANAEAFLRGQSSGFPSVFDPDGKAARSLGGGRVTPSTFFISPGGRRTFTKPGGYTDFAQLDADIRRHALGQR